MANLEQDRLDSDIRQKEEKIQLLKNERGRLQDTIFKNQNIKNEGQRRIDYE